MALHKDLTGAELHEPKGIETAAQGTVYVSNGASTGDWTPIYDGVFNLNEYHVSDTMTDISTPNDKVYLYVPFDSEIYELSAILYGALTTANSILSIYINGVLFADSLTVIQSGSTAGQLHHTNISTANSIPAHSVIEIRTNGGSDTVTKAFITVGLRALA